MQILDFYATWCKPCKVIEPVLQDLSTELNLPLRKINVEDERPLFNKYNVKTVPTIILQDENGNEVGRHTGMITESKLRAFLVG